MSDNRDVDEYDEPTATDPNPNEGGAWVSVVIALLGLWLLIEVFVLDLFAANFWNDVILGVAFLALGGYNYYRRSEEQFGSVAVGAFVAILGLWLLAAPFVLVTDTTATMDGLEFWNDVIVGLLALVLGAYSAFRASQAPDTAPAART